MMDNKCILDVHRLPRHFAVDRANLSFGDVAFMHGDGRKDNVSPTGGAFYTSRSTIAMYNCNFLNDRADGGGGMILFHSNLMLMISDNQTSTITLQNNIACGNGGFIVAYDSFITIDQCNFKNNSAAFGGIFNITTSNLTLVGSSDPTNPMTLGYNIGTGSGGVIFAIKNPTITTTKGTIMFHDNMALDYGGFSTIELFACHF
jgi:hypothetical protein